MSASEDLLSFQLRAFGLEGFEREYRFCPERKWRADFAHPEAWLLIEIEGGTWSGGRHTTGGGFLRDCEKYNAATELGWRVLRYTSSMVESGEAVSQIERVLRKKKAAE